MSEKGLIVQWYEKRGKVDFEGVPYWSFLNLRNNQEEIWIASGLK
jgi:hypothetical protein